ncbi:MAG: V-type ATP synthase subunit A [Planctomycetes bacterium]|nr:V-type ATP synthase subunit A [Planctomycetota bacterium]
MTENIGKIVGIYENMVTAEVKNVVKQNAVAYCCNSRNGAKLKSEIIRIRGSLVDLQVFESTRGLSVGDNVEFTSDLLSVQVGPGLLTQIYDGLQNPLPKLAEECGFFLQPGVYISPLDEKRTWKFTPIVKKGDMVERCHFLGWVPEGIFQHKILVPPYISGAWKIDFIAQEGEYNITQTIARLKNDENEVKELSMSFLWPVKLPMTGYVERLLPEKPLITQQRTIDTMFPVCLGGTYCIPGPFGAGKTVLQQNTSRYADVDIVVFAACGERAGEVVETLREFPHLQDPRTGKSLMERTIIICNTSSMPVAAREASVYTGVTLAEYYRLMGLNVLLLADSTSRWAQALREMSGRLEEIPGEEAFPAYLESVIASFYERAAFVKLYDGSTGSVTIGGTVSPAGGNFEEPVTQGTLKVVGAFHGLSRARSDARRYPAIDPLESWSKYTGLILPDKIHIAKRILKRGNEVAQMMTVIGKEGTSIQDFIIYLKSEFFDRVYLQQNSYQKVDCASSPERQRHTLEKILIILQHTFSFTSKDEARKYFFSLQSLFLNWNESPWQSEAFQEIETKIKEFIQ